MAMIGINAPFRSGERTLGGMLEFAQRRLPDVVPPRPKTRCRCSQQCRADPLGSCGISARPWM